MLLVPDASERIVLNNFLNKVAPQDQVLRLFANDKTPAEGDTVADYTEAAGGGYAQKALTGADWTVATASGTSSAVAPVQTFTFTGPLTTNPAIYGYYVVQATSGLLLWAERASAPFTPANSGDEYRVTPRIEAA